MDKLKKLLRDETDEPWTEKFEHAVVTEHGAVPGADLDETDVRPS